MTTRPGNLAPEYLALIPAVVEEMRKHSAPGRATPAGWAVAALILETVARGDDPRTLFDMGKSTRVRDWTAEAVLKKLTGGASMPEAVQAVAAETKRDVKTVRRHLRAYERELWPGGVKWNVD